MPSTFDVTTRRLVAASQPVQWAEWLPGEGDPRDLDRLVRISDVQRDDSVNGRYAFDEIVTGDGRNAACAAGKAVNERSFGDICRNSGDMLKATGVGLDKNGAIRRAARLLRTGMGGELRAGFEECGL